MSFADATLGSSPEPPPFKIHEMALYDYELTVVAAGSDEPLSTVLAENGLLGPSMRSGEATALGLTAFVEDGEVHVDGSALRVVRLLFDVEPFEARVRTGFPDLVAWLWRVAAAIEPLTMFVPSGSDARPTFERNDPFGGVRRLVASGVPTVAHPVVYYGEALAAGRLCRPRDRIAYYEVERRPGLGCLYVFVSQSDTGTEILESGNLQDEMLAQLR